MDHQSPRLARAAAGVLTALAGAGVATGAAESTGPIGRTLVMAFLLAAPMFAIHRLLPTLGSAVALIVAATGAVVINATVAQTMLLADMWSRSGGVIAVGLVAALLWVVPADVRPRPHELVKGTPE